MKGDRLGRGRPLTSLAADVFRFVQLQPTRVFFILHRQATFQRAAVTLQLFIRRHTLFLEF